jgi:hypothetical protein
MLRFPRELRGYIADIKVLSAARHEPLKFSYFFQLHLFVAFLLVAVLTPEITAMVRSVSARLEKFPPGISLDKKGETLAVRGAQQPLTVSDGDFVVTVDTSGSLKDRPVSSTVFISAEALDVAAMSGRPAQKILWKDGGDFSFVLDELRTALANNEGGAVVVLTLALFLYFFASSVLFSTMIILLWSLVARVSYGLVFKEKIAMRDAIAFHMIAITAPLILWAVCVLSGIAVGPVVEIITLVVYSIIGLRFGGLSKPQEQKPKLDK